MVQHEDGTLIRAATGSAVGSEDDKEFWVFTAYEDKDGTERIRDKKKLRLGKRWMLPNGHHFTMREYALDTFEQNVEDFIRCQHSRDSFSARKLGDRARHFDAELREILTPHSRGENLSFQVRTKLVWGTLRRA